MLKLNKTCLRQKQTTIISEKMSQEIKRTFSEMGLKFQKLKLTILFKITFFYYLLRRKHLELRDQ